MSIIIVGMDLFCLQVPLVRMIKRDKAYGSRIW